MAAIKYIKRTVALDGNSISETLPASFFNSESSAHTFIIAGERDGETVAFTGSVSATFLNANDADVSLTGSIVDGAAVVTLSNDCYALPGRFTLSIDVNGATVYECQSRIKRRSSGKAVATGTIIPSINDLITAINTSVASIPSDYSALLHTLAPDFSASTAYSAGDYAWYNGTLYRFTADHAAGSWTGTDTTSAVVCKDIGALTAKLNVEQGGISLPGIDFDSPARVRTVGYINGSGQVRSLTSGVLVMGAIYYDPMTKRFLTYENFFSERATLSHPEYLARVTFCRTNQSQALTPADVNAEFTPAALQANLASLLVDAGSNTRNKIIVMEQGALSGSLPVDSTKRVRSVDFLPGKIYLDTGDQWTHIFAVKVFDKYGVYQPTMEINPLSQTATLTLDGYFIRVIVARRTAPDGSYNVAITPSSVSLFASAVFDPYELENRDEVIRSELYTDTTKLNSIAYNIPAVTFERDLTMREYNSIYLDFTDVEYTGGGDVRNDTQPETTFLTQIYALFDGLMAQNPQYITKIDLPARYSIAYPEYANGVSGSSEYLNTSPYKMYMYMLRNPLPNIGTENTHPMQRILLIGGTHGNEYASPYNLYLFAKELCENYLDDNNLFNLRSSFQINIIPVLNGYGALHRHRGNANNVDINRNYPCDGWEVRNYDTRYHAGCCGYSGAAAGDQFETQVVMRAVRDIRPCIALDCHNYGVGELHQFYTILPRKGQLNFSYQATTEIAYVLKKRFPQYYGTSFGVLQELPANSPYAILEAGAGESPNYFSEQKVPICGVLEVSNCINYNNGVANGTQNIDLYGTDAFAVAEYTLRNQLIRYCRWCLEHATELDYYWNKPILLP